jgi:methionyl aminopeptidase
MTIESEAELNGLKKIGKIVGLTVRQMSEQLKPGITTAELDAIGGAFLKQRGARSAPRLIYGFPCETCISINDEAAHGIPGDRVIRAGDLVNIDVSAELDGYFADTGATFSVPPVSMLKHQLCRHTRAAQRKAMASAQAGQRLNMIGRAVEAEARRGGFTIIRDLSGHGIGRGLHEEPHAVLNYYEPRLRRRLWEGLVLTIEPFLSTGAHASVTQRDGWTIKTSDGSLCAQYEHTIVITKGAPIVITAV